MVDFYKMLLGRIILYHLLLDLKQPVVPLFLALLSCKVKRFP